MIHGGSSVEDESSLEEVFKMLNPPFLFLLFLFLLCLLLPPPLLRQSDCLPDSQPCRCLLSCLLFLLSFTLSIRLRLSVRIEFSMSSQPSSKKKKKYSRATTDVTSTAHWVVSLVFGLLSARLAVSRSEGGFLG